ncbi:hypothetical protein [Paenibacillus sp. HB172176]|uniref:hypothetical protein n=1 Tax=Paenibacillus sp. HB172176 TaxID=2493690 RepID=UPI001438B992|nr:hypothetical protein [Paenibacillus sp. HB172176]
MVRIGMIGFSHPHAEEYAASIMRLAEPAALWADGEGEHSLKAGVKQAFRSCRSLSSFLAVQMDAVVVAAAIRPGGEQAEALGKLRMPVLAESPIAAGIRTIESLRPHAAYPLRYAPSLREARRRLHSGVSGRPTLLKLSAGLGTFRGASRDAEEVILDLISYLLDERLTLLHRELGRGGERVGEGILLLKSDSGTAVCADFREKRGARSLLQEDWRIDLAAEDEMLHLDLFAQHSSAFEEETGSIRKEYWGDSPFDGVVREFIDAFCGADGGE